MKRCPKCNRTYTTDTQKFCTHDGGILEGVDMGTETVRIDSHDAPTQAISAGLGHDIPAQFDPFKTVISRPETVQPKPRDTRNIESPSAAAPPTPAPPTPPAPAPPDDMMQRTVASIPPPASRPSPPPIASSPPPVPPQQPTQRLVGSGPIASAALPLTPVAQSQPQPPPPAKVAKKSKLPLILGILVVLLVLGAGGLGAAYFFVLRPMLAARNGPVVEPTPLAIAPTPIAETSPTEVPKDTPAPEPPPYSPPADAVQFVSSSGDLDGRLAEHFVEFSFYYPERWWKDPTAGVPGATNFVKVERRLPPDLTQENFAVGSYVSAGSAEGDRAAFHTVAENLSAQLARKFPEYRKVSEGATKVGVYEGYGFRFESISRNTDRGTINVWGRVIILPPVDGSKNGVTLLMLTTSLAPELKSVDDVGVKGELPMMLQSFRFGKN